MGALLVVGVVIVAAFALGGNDKSLSVTRGGSSLVAVPEIGDVATTSGSNGSKAAMIPSAAPTAASDGTGYQAASTGSAAGGVANAGGTTSSHAVDAVAGTRGVGATRVVKTGRLAMTVTKGQVAATIASLTTTTADLGGYVSQSRTEDVDGAPTGSLTLRIPVNRFEDAVTAAAKLGHETALNTSAHDVTGQFVDLSARLAALQRTRATYLTILSRARTIGQTLSVQQRVNDIQQQVESLQGQLKVLRNQSADGTLTVEVSEAGSVLAAVRHHHRSGWSKAWHTSTSRFNRGIQTIISGLGPLLLAVLILGLVYVITRLGARRMRRRLGESPPVVST
jgi:hypothetical protein